MTAKRRGRSPKAAAFALWLRGVRPRWGFTVQEAADWLGISREAYEAWEGGEWVPTPEGVRRGCPRFPAWPPPGVPVAPAPAPGYFRDGRTGWRPKPWARLFAAVFGEENDAPTEPNA